MDESLMPEWMKQAKAAKDLQEARSDSAAKDRTIARMKVQNEGPFFWKTLVEKLTIQKEFLPTAFGLTGTVSVTESSGGEVLCRVEVSLGGLISKSAYINLFYRPEGSIIRCHPQFGGGGDVHFGVTDEKVIVVLGGEYRNPEQAGELVCSGIGSSSPTRRA